MKHLPTAVVLLLLLSLQLFSQAEKISIDDLLSKHRASIGTSDALAGATSRAMHGTGSLESKIGSAFLLQGEGQFASTPKMVVFALAFQNPVYPYEKVAFDGQNASYGLPSGKTTILGNYLKAQGAILKDGLFGGSLSAAWPLLDMTSVPKAKLEMAGTTKINGITCYKVKYSSSRTGPMKVTMYFDTATFRHVRTEYHYEIEPRIGTSPTDVRSSSRVEQYDMIEDFSDFKQGGKLTLPTTYKITVNTEGQIESAKGAVLRTWTFNIDQFYFDEKLTPEMFRVS